MERLASNVRLGVYSRPSILAFLNGDYRPQPAPQLDPNTYILNLRFGESSHS